MTTSEKCARAFMAFYKSERAKSERCLNDIFDLLTAEDGVELSAREMKIVDRLIAHWSRTERVEEEK